MKRHRNTTGLAWILLTVALAAGCSSSPNTTSSDIAASKSFVKETLSSVASPTAEMGKTDIRIPAQLPTPTSVQSPKPSTEGVKNIHTNGRAAKLVKESKHFHFSCSEMDEEFLTDMEKALENNYERVCKVFQYTLNEKVEVEIYPDFAAMKSATGLTFDLVATGRFGKVQMVSPRVMMSQFQFSRDLAVAVIPSHEFTHIVTNKINFDIPMWLKEGIACHEIDGYPDPEISRQRITDMLKRDSVPTLSQMNSFSLQEFSGMGGYECSKTLIDFIVEKYGFDKVNKLLKSPWNIQEIMGMSSDELYNKWLIYLKENYEDK